MPRNHQQNNKDNAAQPELQERVVFINRVSKTVKGGRRMSLSALVVVGDGKGNVGIGMGKSAEVPLAIRKGVEDAKKNMFHVPVTDEGSIPHEVEGHYGAGRVVLRPAVLGTGVLAGGPVRALCELAGIENIIAKSLGTSNSMNIIKAAADGLKHLESPEQTASRRGITVGEMFAGKESD
jgi:small subunit ribosomal protein S5